MVIVMVDRSLAIARTPCVRRPFLPVAFGSEISTADAYVSHVTCYGGLELEHNQRAVSRFSPGRALPGRL